ncbi:hypothetical protein [Pararhizobium arenae]|uniref:hypothetical protein n=1 Tax=Pararhizobium arenae TaxID=1856850 RepID=UPI000AD0CD90|nr:hypothetical protein [Pararhizobium arenae]
MSFISDMTLSQQEIDVLFSALEVWCRRLNAPIDSQDGRDVATVMLGLFKSGHTTKAALLGAMERIDGLEEV